MALIFGLSHQPSLPTPLLFPGQDKLFHGIVFGILGAFYLGSLYKPATGYTWVQVAIATICVLAYGISDEIHQYFVPGRTAEFWDVVADTIGGLLAATIMYLAVRNKAV
jgi:VanZ family protein